MLRTILVGVRLRMSLLWQILYPLKANLRLLKDHHRAVQQICVARNGWLRFQVQLIISICWVRWLKLMAMYPSWMGAESRMMNFDSIYLSDIANEFNFVLASICFIAMHALTILYTDEHCYKFTRLIYQVMIEHQSGYFLQPLCHGRPIYHRIGQLLVWYMQCFQLFTFVAASFIFFLEYTFATQLMGNFHYMLYSMRGLLSLVYSQLNLLLDYVCGLAFAHCCLLGSVLYIAVTLIVFSRLHQVNQLLVGECRQHAFFQFYRFSYFHTWTLLTIFIVNKVYSRLLLVSLALHTPLNAYFLMSMLLGKVELGILPFVVAVFLGQLLVIVGVQLSATRYSYKIHLPGKRLIHFFVHCYVKGYKAKFKLSSYIEKFHTKNQYGITNGAVGLISLSSFAKAIILYSRFIIFSYKLLQITVR